MTESTSLQYPQPTATDRALGGLRLMVGCAAAVTGPAGTLLQVATDTALPSPVLKRREAFFQALADGLGELQARKQINLFDVVADEAFTSAVVEASDIAVRNHSQTKLDALRNAVLNCAIAKADDESKRRTFMRFVDELSEGHVLVLELFQSPQQWFTKRGIAQPQYEISSSLGRLIGDAFPGLVNQRHYVGFIVTELNNRQLADVDVSRMESMMSGRGAFEKRTTAFGDEFLKFISDPGK